VCCLQEHFGLRGGEWTYLCLSQLRRLRRSGGVARYETIICGLLQSFVEDGVEVAYDAAAEPSLQLLLVEVPQVHGGKVFQLVASRGVLSPPDPSRSSCHSSVWGSLHTWARELYSGLAATAPNLPMACFWTSTPCPKASASVAPLDQVGGYGVAPPTLIAAGRLKRRST
jgi:hypothetical protein